MYIEIYTYRDADGGVVIDSETYREIKNLDFAPDVDVTGDSLPIPGFEADIITTDDLHDADTAALYDDMDQLWAQYDLTYAERVDANTVHIRAQSPLYRLDYVELEEAMYEAEPASNVLYWCLIDAGATIELHEDFQNVPITGYCPAQTARERVTWLCFVLGGYLDATFKEYAVIRPVDETETLIPLKSTFWRPAVSYDDWVTAVKLTAYTFTRAESEEAWKADDSSYKFPLPWVAEAQEITLTNPDAPAKAPQNVKEIDELYLVNPSNASAIASRLAKYWFKRATVELDCINNRQYAPGERVVAYTDDQTLMRGYVQSAAFSFGVQARSTLKLIAADARAGARVTVNYLYDGNRIGGATWYFPVGYGFSVSNPYLDKTHDGRRRVYRPLTPRATGTVPEGGLTVDVRYEIALDLFKDVLTVLSVDDIEIQDYGDESIGVIK